jgi:hypothetical protein
MTRSEMQDKTIRNLIVRLEGRGGCSPEIAAMLQDDRLRLYLQTWVITPLQCLNEANDADLSAYARKESARLALSMSGR